MKFDFLTIGGATEDVSLYLDKADVISNANDPLREKLIAFEYGAKIRVQKFHSTFGGGASNAAVALALLKFKTGIISAIGDDARGKNILENFKKFKINTSLIQKIKNIDSGLSFIISADEKVAFTARGANEKLNLGQKEFSAIKKSGWVYLSSLSGAKAETELKKIFANANKIFWNPGAGELKLGKKKLANFLKKTDIFIVNKDEAREFISTEMNIKQMLAKLGEMGVKIAIITDGSNGAYAFSNGKIYFEKAIKAKKVIDATGVGDAFGATFLAGLKIYKGDIEKSLALAMRNARSVLDKPGAQNGLMKRSDI